jgi:hypothetical protein
MEEMIPMPWASGDAIKAKTQANMQSRVARECIGASTLRQSKPGTMAAVIAFLSAFDLTAFAEAAKRDFELAHVDAVSSLQAYLAAQGLSNEFGRCAKALDLFLRGAVVHHYLRMANGLGDLEAALHLPLDGMTMDRLRKDSGDLLPQRAIMHLSTDDYGQYQAFASGEAARRGEARIFLDDDYWAVRTKNPG